MWLAERHLPAPGLPGPTIDGSPPFYLTDVSRGLPTSRIAIRKDFSQSYCTPKVTEKQGIHREFVGG